MSSQSETWTSHLLVLLLLSWVILGLGARFWGVTELGVSGSDTYYYTYIAESWSHVKFVNQFLVNSDSKDDTEGGQFWRATNVYRPVVYALYGLSYKVFGLHDFSIKLLNILLDIGCMFLMFGIGCLLQEKPRFRLAILPVLAWVILPRAIYLSRIELPHTASTIFVLATLFCFLVHYRYQGRVVAWISLPLAGALAGATALTHEELILLAVPYGFMLCWQHLRNFNWRRAAVSLLLFSVPMLSVANALLRLHLGTAASLVTGRNPSTGQVAPTLLENPLRPIRFAWYSISYLSHFVWALGFFVVVLWLVISWGFKWRRDKELRLLALPTMLVVSHYILYSLFFPNIHVRTTLPLLSLVFVVVVLGGTSWLRQFGLPDHWAFTLILCLVLLSLPLNLENFGRYSGKIEFPKLKRVEAGVHHFWRQSYSPSWTRSRYDQLEHLVNSKARLLVASSLMYPYPGRRSFQAHYYFGDEAVYLIDHQDPLEKTLRNCDIRWVLFSGFKADKRVLAWDRYKRYLYGGDWSSLVPIQLGAALGLDREHFNLRTEYQSLVRQVEALGGRRVSVSPGQPAEEGGEGWVIYRLPNLSPRYEESGEGVSESCSGATVTG